MSDKPQKLQKVLAEAGYGSRRTIEKWISAGRLRVNQSPAILGVRVSPTDKIYLDNKLCRLKNQSPVTRVLLYNKPEGLLCTRHDPEGRDTIFQQLPRIHSGRWLNIGRLDINTSGLLLITNNGELANQLMHPKSQIQREYAVRVRGVVTESQVKSMVQGVELEDGLARFEDIAEAGGEKSNRWFHVVVMAGRNRLVRRLWESQGLQVSRLIRVRFGDITLPRSLRPGRWLELSQEQIEQLIP